MDWNNFTYVYEWVPLLISLFWNDNQVEQFIMEYRIPVTVISGVLVMVIMYFIYRNRRTDFDVSP